MEERATEKIPELDQKCIRWATLAQTKSKEVYKRMRKVYHGSSGNFYITSDVLILIPWRPM